MDSKPARADIHNSVASSFKNTLRGSHAVDADESPNRVNLAIEPARKETIEDVEH